MIGAMFKMAFQTHTGRDASPSKLLETINDEMFRVLPDSDFLTVFFGVIDPNSLNLCYSNGGHPKPFFFRAADRAILELEEGGPLIGAFDGMDYDEGSLTVAPGDRILIFTDGVTEAAGRTTRLIFMEKSASWLRSYATPICLRMKLSRAYSTT